MITLRISGFPSLAAGLLAILFAAMANGQSSPLISSISPASVQAGSSGLQIQVNGNNITSGTVLFWNDRPLATLVLSPFVATASIPAGFLTTPGTATLVLRNPFGLQSGAFVFTILPALTVDSTSLPDGIVGSAYTFNLTASGSAPPLTWSAQQLPPGLTVNTAGMISGTPTSPGTFTVSVLVVDANQRSAQKSLAVRIIPPALSVTTTSLPPATVGQAYSQTIMASGGTAPLQWRTSSSLPGGLTLSQTGVLTGTPTVAGAFEIAVVVTDAALVSVNRSLSLRVLPPALSIVTVAPLFEGTVGSPYTQSFSAAGGVPPYQWVLRQSPPGLTLSASTGTLSGTPEAAGIYPVTVEVVDSAGTTRAVDYTITIKSPAPLITNPSVLPAATAGTPYSVTLSTVNLVAPIRWAIVLGGVAGLSLDPATGVLSGAPETAGNFTVGIEARDSASATATKTFSLTVRPAALTFRPSSLSLSATMASPFTEKLAASGGVPPYTWTAVGLPQGLRIESDGTLTGNLTGTPTVAGQFQFTVTITDFNRTSASALLQANVNLPPAEAVTFPDLPPTVLPAEQLPLRLALPAPYAVNVTGTVTLTFAPDVGLGDDTLRFSTGSRSATFQIRAGQTAAVFDAPDLMIQTGTVAGVISVNARLQAFGLDVPISSVPRHQLTVERGGPVITNTRLTRGNGTVDIDITGYSTSREIGQAVFQFRVTQGGSPLQTPSVTIPVTTVFAEWFANPSSARFGSQFRFTQRFTVQGDTNAIQCESVTLSNRFGSATATVP